MAITRKSLLNTIKYLSFFGIGLLLLYLAFRGNDIEKLVEDLKHADYSWVFLSLIFGTAAYVSRAMRWLILLEPMGYNPKLSNSIYAVIIGYFANLAIPRIGEITRCTALNQVEKIPVDKLFGTVILERVIDLIILLSITVVTILLNINTFGNFFFELFNRKAQNSDGIPLLVIFIGLAILIGLVLLFIFRNRLLKFNLFQKVRAFVKGIKDGFVAVIKLKKKRWFIFHTLIIWVFYYLMAYVCFFSIEQTSHLSPIDGLFVLSVGGFGMAAPVQGGIGAYHYIVSLGLGVLGVEFADGLLFATIVHTSQTILTLIAGTFAVVMLYLARRKLTPLKPSGATE